MAMPGPDLRTDSRLERRLKLGLVTSRVIQFAGVVDYFAVNLAIPHMSHNFPATTMSLIGSSLVTRLH